MHYYELRYEDGKPDFRRGHLDELDFGLDLDVESAAAFHVGYEESKSGVHGFSVGPGSVGEGRLDAAAWDVTRGGG